MDYVWDVFYTAGLTSTPPSSAIFPEYYKDIRRDYTSVGNSDMAVMGRGTWGVVRKVQRRSNEMRKAHMPKFACKTILKSKLSDPVLLRREVYNLKRCQAAPHVVQLVDVYEDYDAVHIIMEECKGMELYEELQVAGEEGLDEEVAANIIHQALTSLAYMHEVYHVAHRDIKASNFMFAHLNLMKEDGKELEIKLIDFGFSKHVVSTPPEGGDVVKKVGKEIALDRVNSSKSKGGVVSAPKSTDVNVVLHVPTMDATDSDDELLKNKCGVMTSEVGTPCYTAPEVLTQHTYDFKCDVYSVGVLAYLCLTGKLPIKGKTERDTIKMIMKGKTEIDFSDSFWFKKEAGCEASDGKEEKASSGKVLSLSARDFCQALLQRDPKGRPTAYEALQLEWMTSRFGEPAELPPPMPDRDPDSKLPDLKRVSTASFCEPTLPC